MQHIYTRDQEEHWFTKMLHCNAEKKKWLEEWVHPSVLFVSPWLLPTMCTLGEKQAASAIIPVQLLRTQYATQCTYYKCDHFTNSTHLHLATYLQMFFRYVFNFVSFSRVSEWNLGLKQKNVWKILGWRLFITDFIFTLKSFKIMNNNCRFQSAKHHMVKSIWAPDPHTEM